MEIVHTAFTLDKGLAIISLHFTDNNKPELFLLGHTDEDILPRLRTAVHKLNSHCCFTDGLVTWNVRSIRPLL